MKAHVGWAGPAGTNGIQQCQMSNGSVDRVGTDGALLAVARPVRLVGRVKASPGAVQSQATRAGSEFIDATWGHRAGRAVDLKEVDPAAVAWRQIHLRRQNIAERG